MHGLGLNYGGIFFSSHIDLDSKFIYWMLMCNMQWRCKRWMRHNSKCFCMVWFAGHLIPLEDATKRNGLNTSLILQCLSCNAGHSFMTSSNLFKGKKPGKCADINRRAAMAASEVGLGRAGLADITSIMDMQQPSAPQSYQRHLKHLTKASDTVHN